jgi:hypothetical protein
MMRDGASLKPSTRTTACVMAADSGSCDCCGRPLRVVRQVPASSTAGQGGGCRSSRRRPGGDRQEGHQGRRQRTAGACGPFWWPWTSARQRVEQPGRQRQGAEYECRGCQDDGQGKQGNVVREEDHTRDPSREDPDHVAQDSKASMTPTRRRPRRRTGHWCRRPAAGAGVAGARGRLHGRPRH